MLLRPKQNSESEGRASRWGRRGAAAVTFASRLVFEGVTRTFGRTAALDDFSLDAAPGEIVCLLGRSGCGKTTALRLAAGVDIPTSGRIRLDTMEIAGPAAFVPPEKRGIGLMFQDFALFPHLSIAQNVAFGLRDLGRKAAKAESLAALDRVGLVHYADEYPHILSGGEQQRVALARAIAPRPNVILMDEPFSGLDPQLRDAMRDETHTILREMRATCVIVTHHPEEAMRLGDRIAIMRKGRLVQCGTAETLYRSPADIDVARNFSDLNEFEGRVSGQLVATPIGNFPAPGIADGERAIVCLRQRGLRIAAEGPGAPGQVRDTRFLGDVSLVEIRIDGEEKPVFVRIDDASAPERGTRVTVTAAPNAALVFPAADTEL